MHIKKGIIRNTIAALIIMLVMGVSVVITSMGKDTSNEPVSRQIQLLTLDKDTNAYAQPSETSEVLRVIKAGTAVAVAGEEGDYTVIIYQGHDEYIKTEDITMEAKASSEASAKECAEEVDEEFDKFQKEDVSYLESLERQKLKSRNALIWKIVIVILVICIMAISVIMGVKKNLEDKETGKDEMKKKGQLDKTDN